MEGVIIMKKKNSSTPEEWAKLNRMKNMAVIFLIILVLGSLSFGGQVTEFISRIFN